MADSVVSDSPLSDTTAPTDSEVEDITAAGGTGPTPFWPGPRTRGARILSALLWIVGTALVVLALAFAIVVVLAILN